MINRLIQEWGGNWHMLAFLIALFLITLALLNIFIKDD